MITKKNKKLLNNKYKHSHFDDVKSIYQTDKGLSIDIIKKVSQYKQEPEWMLAFRLKSYANFLKLKNPVWFSDLDKHVNFDEYNYFISATNDIARNWDDVPIKIKNTFQKIGIMEAEQKFLSGVSTQYESEVIYGSLISELEQQGVIFCDTDTALKLYPDIFKRYFSKVITNSDNKYAALNSSIWSGGSFIYVPKGVKIDKPLQSYFRINSRSMGQFERTLIILDEDAELHYIEGCTAPIYDSASLHAAVVEIYVSKNAKMRYTTIQNWSDNILNLVTKRAYVEENGLMEWIDGNIGAKINLKYPCCVLAGKHATGYTLSIAVASSKIMHHDTGAKMIHLVPNTTSNIISKSIAYNGGQVDYRGKVFIAKEAINSFAKVSCDTLLLDDISSSKTTPINSNNNHSSIIEHEATISKISDTDIAYFTSKGIHKEAVIKMLTLGFIDIFAKELPMEYAVELNQLLKINMEGSIG